MGNKQANMANTTLVSIIAVLSITVGLLGVHLYNMKGATGELEAEALDAQATKTELTKTYKELDEISLRLESQINEIAELGGRVDSLLEIKKQLEHDKYQLQLSKNITVERFQKIKGTVSKYETLIQQKNNEIAFLQERNQKLTEKYDSLEGSAKNLSDELNNLKNQNENLSTRVASAAVLKATNFKLKAVSSSGKTRFGNEFKVKHIDRLHINFNIADNTLAEVGGRKIYLRIIEPDGKTLFNSQTGSGKFQTDGNEEFYTMMKEILFDNSQQIVSYPYKKGNPFKKGTHKIEIFCDGHIMGHTSFKVK